ncbi:MAG: deoxyribonuclease IV [Candidatus Paraimprobicoccus trichonymphae]|uniref:Probable endonuclease 4 n=1 Tax=Candidatus Paraimprobicoccus trichonymphae TaxID=3033793 RepID=A0AA48I6K8_9FIRM|nr:MAG: deoxyribonuclease IV [Candidatus Paraimprobicoccus trichonymphae]
MIKINIGCHLSISNGFEHSAKMALSIDANTFQFFPRNPRGGRAVDFEILDIENFLEISQDNNFSKIVAHAPYTYNLCSANPRVVKFSINCIKNDLENLEKLPENYYNIHPGSHTGQGIKIGIEKISQNLNDIILQNQSTIILLETMSGKGSEVGGNFGDLKEIINNIDLKEKIGICLDTCHVFDSGYDIKNNLENVLENFDKLIGINRLKVIHLNDSKNLLNSKKDRHENLGYGKIGISSIEKIVKNKYLEDLIFILETPQKDLLGYKSEINFLLNYVS